jgi:hypothetical protein
MLENVLDELIIIYDAKQRRKCRILYLFNKNSLQAKIFNLLLGDRFLFQTVFSYFFCFTLMNEIQREEGG